MILRLRHFRLVHCKLFEEACNECLFLTKDRMEFAGMKLEVSDVDEASSILRQLLRSEDLQNVAAVQRIASARVLDLTENEESTITNLYDSILQHWVAPLPSNMSIRIRQH